MKKGAIIYLVWVQEADGGFWNQYESVEDAVSDQGEGTEVYSCVPQFLGCYERKVLLIKSKKKNKK